MGRDWCLPLLGLYGFGICLGSPAGVVVAMFGSMGLRSQSESG